MIRAQYPNQLPDSRSPDPLPDHPITRSHAPACSADRPSRPPRAGLRAPPRPHDPGARLRRAAVPRRPHLRARRRGLRDPRLHRRRASSPATRSGSRFASPAARASCWRRSRRCRRTRCRRGRRRRSRTTTSSTTTAELQCQWDPLIPFAGARIEQRFDLRIAESSRLYLERRVMAGRVSRGEAWRFQSLAHELRLRIGASLAYLERYTLAPASRQSTQPMDGGHSALPRDRDCASRRGHERRGGSAAGWRR